MPKVLHRKIYDDDGEEMLEGATVLVNGKHECILHFNDEGEIDISDIHWDDVETIEKLPDDRFEEIDAKIIH